MEREDKALIFYYSTRKLPGLAQTPMQTPYGTVWIRYDEFDGSYADALGHATPHDDECVMNGHPAPGKDERPFKRYVYHQTWAPANENDPGIADSEYVFVYARDDAEAERLGEKHPDIRAAVDGLECGLIHYAYTIEIPPESEGERKFGTPIKGREQWAVSARYVLNTECRVCRKPFAQHSGFTCPT